MVIKNLDGSEYKLKGPNPIMKTQNLWDEFQIHNMNFDEIIDKFKNENKKTTILNLNKDEIVIEDLKKSDNNIKLEPEINEKPTENIIQIETPKEEPILKEQLPEKEENNNFEINKTSIHCLPANVSIKEDFLYGDVKKIVKYSEKFKFDAVLLEITDFQISFWTNLKLSNESIIYPKNSDKRWWKITGSEPKFNGNIYYGKISDITPNFED